VLCRAHSGAHLLCDRCAEALPVLGPACPGCALPSGCECARRPPPWSRAVAAWRYDFPLDRLVQDLKYGGRLALAEPLGDGLARAARHLRCAPLPDALVPLPLSPLRQRSRGFNQAQLLAARVAQHLGVPILRGLARCRDAGPQAALPLTERDANVRDAFRGTDALRGLRVAVVDDVMTTGATLAAAARAARGAGALDVEVWALARTLR
jgi:ComF family protein